MAVDPSIYPKSVVYNGTTWSATTTGGPLNGRYMHEGAEQEHRSGDDLYPQAVFITNRSLRVFVTLSDVKQVLVPGVSSSLVMTLTTKAGTAVLTFSTMIFVGANGNQPRGIPGEVELAFVHQSADGQTVPIT